MLTFFSHILRFLFFFSCSMSPCMFIKNFVHKKVFLCPMQLHYNKMHLYFPNDDGV